MTIDFGAMVPGHKDQGIQREKLTVDDGGGYTGNRTLYLAYPMRELLISNDSITDDLTVVVTGPASYSITFTLLPNEILDERFYPFHQLDITAVGAWRYIVRSGRIA